MNTKYVNIFLIILIVLSSLFVFAPPFKVEMVTATIVVESNPVMDGVITWSGGGPGGIVCDKQNTQLKEGTEASGAVRHMSFIEWDISAIPDSATITSVGFNVYGDGWSIVGNQGDFVGITIQPSAQTNDTAGWTTLYDDIWGQVGTQYKFLGHNSFTDDAYININDTGGTAWDISPAADIQASLAGDWFAMSLAVGAGVVNGYAAIDSENNTEGHIAPTLWIEYQITTPEITGQSPTDGGTNVNMTPTLCVDVEYSQFGEINYSYNELTIDHDFVSASLLNFPVLVSIPSAVGQFCNSSNNLQFWSLDNSTQYNHEVEYWDAGGTSIVWVNVTMVEGTTNTTFWIRYNNDTWTNSEHIGETWNNEYILVYHMNSTGTNVVDSTNSSWHNGTKEGVNNPEEVAGYIAKCQDFEVGDTEWITAANNTDFMNQEQTIEIWINPETLADVGFINKNEDAVGTNSWTIYMTAAGKYQSYVLSDGLGTGNHTLYYNTTNIGTTSGAVVATAINTAVVGRWSKITVAYDNYLTGLGGDDDLGLGFTRWVVGVKNGYADCKIDEVRISNVRRNASWINASFHSENCSTGFLTWGTAMNNGSGNAANLTWLWYNGTGFEEIYTTEGLVANGTFCDSTITRNRNLTPCTLYWWGVRVEDANGNFTEDYFSFTTFCVDPPTNLGCERINNTALNITWTPLPDYNGTTYTIIRYLEGYNIPEIDEGTELYNGTGYHVNLSNLSEATCYAISAWTYWKAPNGTWILSANKATSICCSAGGDYTVMFRYENTSVDSQNNPINLTLFPCSTHRIILKYENGLEDVYYITEASDNPFTIAARFDVLYIEAWWNWSVNSSCCYNETNSYYRRLTPNAAWNDSGNATLDFYFIVDRPIYNDYRNVYQNNVTYETDFEDNLVRYIYSFLDFSGEFTSPIPNDIYSSIYAFNSTKQLIIHQDYWDAAQKVYPVLLFDKNYWQTVYRITTANQVYLGFCPTDEILQETLQIKLENLSSSLDNAAITYDWKDTGTGAWLYYHDIDIITTHLYFWVHLNNETSTPVYYLNKTGVSEWNFTNGMMGTLDQNNTYILKLTYVRNVTTDVNNPQYVVRTATRVLIPGISSRITAAYLDTLIEGVFGKSPFYKPGDTSVYIPWSTIIALGISIIVGFGLAGVDQSGTAPCLGFGITLMVVTFIVTGMSVLYLLGLVVTILGIALLIGRKK